jgi:hypothetical protein
MYVDKIQQVIASGQSSPKENLWFGTGGEMGFASAAF